MIYGDYGGAGETSTVDIGGLGPTLTYNNYSGTNQQTSGALPNSPAPTPPHFNFTFDTIGQVIYRTLGACRMPFRYIWARDNGDGTVDFAAALCAPIDPEEEGNLAGVWNGTDLIFSDTGGITIPDGLDATTAAQLIAAIGSIIMYPGTEAQLPDPTITADKGAANTPAFRGLRYIIVRGWPAKVSANLSGQYTRTNALNSSIIIAVAFDPGAS